jgi:hypothetical protein
MVPSLLEQSLTSRSQIFTLEVDNRAVMAFEAADVAEAQDICKDPDLRTDLCALTSDGAVICSASAVLTARAADENEVAAFERAVALAPASDEPTMAFLIKVDGVVVVSLENE